MVFSYIILGTPFMVYYIYALVLILGALIIQNKYSKRAPRYLGAKDRHTYLLYDITGAFVENTHPHIYQHIRGNGRALATKLKIDSYSGLENKDAHGCLVFTNKNPPESVKKEEIAFIENLIGPSQDELVLMAVGDVDSVEQALEEHMQYLYPQ
jgi:hypothetical protein